jgi:small subunit ribosomal protein S16
VAVTLRMARHGKKKQPIYRIVATNTQNKRDGRFIEVVGTYNPKTNPPTAFIKDDLVKKWLAVGAQPSQVVCSIIKKSLPGILEERETKKRAKIQASRKARKQRIKAKKK